MNLFPILFVLVVVCLAVAVEAHKPKPVTTTTKKPTTTAETTTKSTASTTTTTKPVTSKTTGRPTTITTSKKTTVKTPPSKPTTLKTTTAKPTTITTSKTTVKPSSSTIVRTTSTKTATTTTTPSPVLLNCFGDNQSGCENMCGAMTSTISGVVQSPHFPADYGNEFKKCNVTIVVSVGKRIQLTFTTFNLELFKASINVFDNETTYLSDFTGSTIPLINIKTANIMYIGFNMFKSTKPNTAIYNWKATYTAV